jgi:hypothetical protein
VIVAASTPDAPSTPVTSIENIYVKIDWNAPASNSAPIDGYYVYIAKSDGVFVQETVYCNGFVSAAVLADSYCLVPMSTLIAAPYSLTRGTIIRAKVKAHNEYGDSLESAANSAGEKIQTGPTTVANLVSGSGTSETQVQLDWDALSTDA